MVGAAHFKVLLKPDRHDYLVLDGTAPDSSPVLLLIDGVACATAQPGKTNNRFKFVIRQARDSLRDGMALSVKTGGKTVRDLKGRKAWVVPEGFAAAPVPKIDILAGVAQGLRLDKKGYLSRALTDDIKDRYFSAYTLASAWFRDYCGYDLLVSHGTLLGLYRDGDMIPNDDDFDCLYLSRKTDIAAVVAERIEIMSAMSRSGFSARVGKTGHIKFKSNDCRLDLMPAWLDGDTLNIAGFTSLPGGAALARTLGSLPFRSGLVRAFADPEPFFVHQYGPGWRTPEPGFRSTPSRTERANRKALKPGPAEIALHGIPSLREPRMV